MTKKFNATIAQLPYQHIGTIAQLPPEEEKAGALQHSPKKFRNMLMSYSHMFVSKMLR
jgi:hypothetical protein